MKSRWIILAVIVIGSGVALWRLDGHRAVVVAIRPERQPMSAYIEEQAVTELRDDHLVAMPLAGTVVEIAVREGDRVTSGQVVARVDAADLEDRVHQAEQRIAVLDAQIAEVRDHRLEENALVEMEATVKAIDETVAAAVAKLEATRALVDFATTELQRIQALSEGDVAADRELRAAHLEFQQATAQFEGDKLELAALRTLAAVSYIGPKFITDTIDRKSFTLAQRERELAEARTQLQIEQRHLSRAVITAPVGGVVLHRHQSGLQFLPAGSPLVTIGQLDRLEVVAEVLTERAPHIEIGDAVEIFGEAIATPVGGRVARIYPAGFRKISSLGVEQQRVRVAITPDLRPAGLGVGFRVYVRILHDAVDDALTLPRTALYRTAAGSWEVLAIRAGRIVAAPVVVGLLNDDRAQIVSGLTSEDDVVAYPDRELQPGMRVEVESSPYSALRPPDR